MYFIISIKTLVNKQDNENVTKEGVKRKKKHTLRWPNAIKKAAVTYCRLSATEGGSDVVVFFNNCAQLTDYNPASW